MLTVVYDTKYYPEYDEVICKKLNKKIENCGTGIGFEERDITIYYKNLKDSANCFKRVSTLKKVKSISINYYK